MRHQKASCRLILHTQQIFLFINRQLVATQHYIIQEYHYHLLQRVLTQFYLL
jgi:hypothetical protein